MRQLKGDNRGLSLLEVLIAIVVLSIVVVPFMHAFITAANTNADAKREHKATVVAQSVMEGFKAEPLDEIIEQFQDPTTDFHILDPDRINGSIASAVAMTQDPATPGVYRFDITGVQEDTSAYDVRVTLDATAYRDPANTTQIQYNNAAIAQLPVVDMDKDAVCIQKPEYTETAVSRLYNELYLIGTDEDEIRNNMKREITVNIEKTYQGGGEYRTKVVAEYNYSYGGYNYSVTQTDFDSLETGEELRSIYLYYYPLYSSGVTRDVINFVNNGSLPVNFYLLKQDTGNAGITSASNENAYCVAFNIEEPGATAADLQKRLYTNLGINLVDGSTLTTGLREVKLNLSAVQLANVVAPELFKTTTEDRLYDLTVSVYESGANFLESGRLTTLEGSRID